MKRNVLLFISLCVVGCVMTYAQQMPGLLQKGKADTQDCKAWVDEQLSEMSLKEKIGQLFIHTVAPLQTQRNKNNIYAAIKEYKVGGLLFSGGQLSDQVLLTNYAQSLAEVPLLITFDGEWGLAMRLKGTPRFPRNRVLGCIQDNELLYEYGKEVARQCKKIGVQINFAPVADVDVNPRNPVINTRSFGGDPRNVAQKAPVPDIQQTVRTTLHISATHSNGTTMPSTASSACRRMQNTRRSYLITSRKYI